MFLAPPKPAGASGYRNNEKQDAFERLAATGVPNILLRGGSRSGKTFVAVKFIVTRALASAFSRHAIFRQRLIHLRASIWSDTFPKVMRLRFPLIRYRTNAQEMTITFDNGSVIYFGGLDDKTRTEKILGMEFVTIYYNEITQISYNSILLGLTRLAQAAELPQVVGRFVAGARHLLPMALFDCNPPRKQHYSYQLFFEKKDPITGQALESPEEYAEIQMNPGDNKENLSPQYLKRLSGLPPEQRKRFLDGEFGSGVEGAMWDWPLLAGCRVETVSRATQDYDLPFYAKGVQLPEMRRIIVAVDPPAGGKGARAAECGIVVCGLGYDRHCYVLGDHSIKGGVDKWTRVVAHVWGRYGADKVIAEVNNGGDLVENAIRGADSRIGVEQVRASRGKAKRAEPVAVLYRNGLVHHAGDFGELENQMVEITPDFDADEMGYSPDRVDALVWGVSSLMLGESRTVGLARVMGT